MYWLYVILFVCTLIVPGFVEQGWLPLVLSREITEIVFIFIFATLAFILYIIRDYQFLRYEKELIKKQKEVNRLTKELTSSYSYIGEVNRKFEILQDVTLEMPELISGEGKEKVGPYHDILRAIRIFSGCQDFVVVLFSVKEKKECAQFFLPDSKLTSLPRRMGLLEMIHENIRFVKNKGEYCVMEASGTIADLHCLGIFHRSSLRDDIVDLIRPLLMQILLLYAYAKNK